MRSVCGMAAHISPSPHFQKSSKPPGRRHPRGHSQQQGGRSPGASQVQVHGHEENEGQGNCLALVPRSEGLVALPLIATSVTRNCQRRCSCRGKEEHDFLPNLEKEVDFMAMLKVFGVKHCAHHKCSLIRRCSGGS